MSRFARRVLSLILIGSLVFSQTSAFVPARPAASISANIGMLTMWRNELTAALSNLWLAVRPLVPVQGSPTLDDMRAGTPNLPDAPSGTNTAPPSGYDDPAPTSTANFAAYYTQMSTRRQATGIAGSKPLQNADPTAGNTAISGISVNLDSSNYSFTAPIVSLGGRAGLGTSLALTYNSRVWTKANLNDPYYSPVAFNVERGFPAPGWRLGFGAIQGVNSGGAIGPFTSTITNKPSFTYIKPDGTRHELGLNTTTGLYESYDSSWLDFNVTSKVLRTTDSTQVTFAEAVTTNGDYQFLPTEIKDRQGNFITIVYKTLSNNDRVLDYVLDTVGRRLDFYYESNRLREIRQDRNGTLMKLAVIDYQPVTITGSFSSTLAIDPPTLIGSQVYVPTRITYPTGVNYRFYYTSYAQVWLFEKWAPSISGQGTARRLAYTRFRTQTSVDSYYVAYSMPSNSLANVNNLLSGQNLLTAPTFDHRADQAENWNAGIEYVTYYGANNYNFVDSYGMNKSYSISQYLSASGTWLVYKLFYNYDPVEPGYPVSSYPNVNTPRQRLSQPYKNTDVIFETDAGVSWLANARPKETTIIDFDPSTGQQGNTRWTGITYSLLDGIQLPTQVDVATAKTASIYSRTTTTYTSYPTQRILGLPLEVSTYEGAGTKLVTRTTNSYDQSGGFTDANGLALNYLLDESAAQVIQHDNTNYTVSFTARGNLTSVTQSAVNSSGTVTGSRVLKRMGYDTNGNMRWTTDAAGNRAQLLYTDNFLNKPASVGNTQAYVYTAADPTGMRAGKQYDYWTGNVLKTFNLKPNSSTEEQVVTTSYDFADRPFQTTQPTGAWGKTFYWDNLLYLTVVQKTDTVGGVDQISFSFSRTDGTGRVLGKGNDHPNAVSGKYSGQKFLYNERGLQSNQSNVTAINGSWTPIDEDAGTGWLWQNYQYDDLGRITQITHVDSSTYTAMYQGCGCAGALVTTIDERGCKVQTKTNFLGRLESAKEGTGQTDSWGNPLYYNSAFYTYDVLGKLLQIDVKQWDNGTKTQTRTFNYDDYGRLVSETTPEAGTMTYTYNANDQIANKTDARGKVTTLNYNSRNLVTSVSYSDSTPGAAYGYDEYGARTSMTDGQGTMSYVFDANRRLQSETRTFTDLTNQTFTLTYGYNAAGQLKQVNYGSSTGLNKNVNYAYNAVGALTSVGTNLIGTDPNATTNVLSGLSYNGFGAVKTLNYGNGRRLTLTYDVYRHQMLTMKVDKQDGTDVIINKTYSYVTPYMNDNDGRIKKITDALDGNYTTTYSYDMYNRLTSASSTAFSQSYNYDEWGNLRSLGASWNPSVTYNFTNNASGAPATNRMNSITVSGVGTTNFTWDAAGNMTGEGSTTYQYDAAGRMVSVNNGSWGSYGFDGDGKRVKKTEGGVSVYYVESSVLGKTAFEVTSAGLNRALVSVGNKMVALLAPDSQFYWIHDDHLGTGRKMTNSSGGVVYRGEFDPHGNVLLETGTTTLNNHKFAGYERDASGLDYAQARMFIGSRGRFTSPDPHGTGCGNKKPSVFGAANPNLPQTFNRYVYANNDPINVVDRTGRYIECWGWFLVDSDGVIREFLGLSRCVSMGEDYSKSGGLLGGGGGGGNNTPASRPRYATCEGCCTVETRDCDTTLGNCLKGGNNWISRGANAALTIARIIKDCIAKGNDPKNCAITAGGIFVDKAKCIETWTDCKKKASEACNGKTKDGNCSC